MKTFGKANIVLISFLIVACGGKGTYKKVEDGVRVHLSSGAQVKVAVISDKIIHVVASPEDSVIAEKSLVLDPARKLESTAWNVEEDGDHIVITTPSVRASVSLKTGEVEFADQGGKTILKEKKDGGKSFVPLTTEKGWQVRQEFESPDDEAFYGLGGHQNGQVNYKGEDVELAQHNIVDVVPFLYSSKNYGILWDNYSISKFGDPRDYLPLSSLQLFNREGKRGGLTADYYVADKIVKSADEDKIDFEYLETPQLDSFPKDVARNGKIVWEGSFASDAEGVHKFLVYASGYFKIWVDDSLIMDKWRQNWNPWTNKFTTSIKKGEKHKLKIEWITQGGYFAFKHLDPISDAEQNRLSLFSEVGDAINYYFIKGDNADDVIHGYRQLTGKAPIVPKWAMGFWQSRERYRSQQQLIETLEEYRKRKIPIDNIVLDWQYWKDPNWGSHEFDSERFPDPEGMVNKIHNTLHANIMISVWPKFNKGTANYEEMSRQGFLFTRNVEKKRKDWVGPGYENTFYDPFNPAAGKLFWNQIDRNLNKIGIDGWWLDATEPDMHSNLSIEERKNNMSPTAMGSGARYFNAYSLLNSKSVYEGQRKSSPEKRVFILTRSAFAGQQRYGAVTWSGDIVSRWSDFRDQIATGINFSLSGIPYWTMDIGGFAVEKRYENATGETLDEWKELNTRWFQFGAFCPIFRSHGQYPFREIFNISSSGETPYESMVYYDRLRYRMLPYLYSLAGKCYFDDYTMLRGLVMDFNDDVEARNITDQYMLGPALLINPVLEYKLRQRELYLPKGAGWYDFNSGKFYDGGQKIKVDAPLQTIPLLVRSGSIIPLGPELQYSSEKPADPITLYVYEGANGTFSLYEDEGVNYNYEKGSFSRIVFNYDDASKTLTIGNREGSFPGMIEKRTFRIVWVKKDHPVGLDVLRPPFQEVRYEGKQTPVKQE